MSENPTQNTPGAAIGSIIVIIVLLAGAIYFGIDYFGSTPNTGATPTSTSTAASSTPIASSTPSTN